MAKNIVLFSDGTGNSARKLFKTNVWRVYQVIDLKDPQNPQEPRQFAFYDDGVGTSAFKPLAVLGGAFGVGLARNVVDLYVFLCRMYEPGDHIYAFGFSRGAFTIRVLLGLVMTQGLLRYHGSESDLKRLALDAYRTYRTVRFTSLNPLVGLLRGLRTRSLRVLNRLLKRPDYADADRVGMPGRPDAITVDFVGLWDTVDAYGLPVDELTHAVDKWIWPLTMRDCNLHPRIVRARHALSLDDERNTFHPRLWNEVPDPGVPDSGVQGANEKSTHVDQERISQVWFAGVHSNVGGGYPDDSLSYVSLAWILGEANKYGLRFEKNIWDELLAMADENGPLVDSRRGVAGYYRYNPRRIERLTRTPQVSIARTKVHESVLRRIQAGHDGYAPIGLPPDFAVMRVDGDILDAQTYLRQMRDSAAHRDAPDEPDEAAIRPAPPLLDAAGYREAQELVFNTVWQRRVAYFATLAFTVALLAMPLFAPGTPACSGPLCFLAAPVSAVGALLPDAAGVWIESFASHPHIALPLLAAILLGMRAGKALEATIRDRMRRIWYGVSRLRPASAVDVPAPAPRSTLDRVVWHLRSHGAYVAPLHFAARRVLPGALLLAIGYAAVALVG